MTQPNPVHTAASRPVTEQVIADLQARTDKGVETYGVRLHTFNGRSAMQDAYEEALDLAQYLKQALMEQPVPSLYRLTQAVQKLAHAIIQDDYDKARDIANEALTLTGYAGPVE